MALRKKDGSEYRLRGPDANTGEHALWKKGEYILHNMRFRELILEKDLFPNNQPPPSPPINQPPQTESIPEPEPPRKNSLEVPEKKIQVVNGIKILIYPAVKEIVEDELYDISRGNITYENTLEENGIIEHQSDLELVVLFREKYGGGTILVPLNGDRRWWKIDGSERRDRGFLHRCIPSDQSPRFS